MTELPDAALAFGRRGIAVFPLHYPVNREGLLVCSCGNPKCKDAAKHPYARHAPNGLKNATTDLCTIGRWWSPGTPYNIGARSGAPSGFVVVDVDPRHGGHESLARLEEQHGPLPPTWRSITGGGGEHIFLRHPGHPVPNAVGTIAPGIDLRGDGGYVVAPPSLHISGRNYAWNVDHHPDDFPLAPMPLWLLDRTVAREKPRVELGRTAEGPIPEGRRNETVTSILGQLLRRWVEPRLAASLVRAFNRAYCSPPLGDAEIERIIASIAERERQRRERIRHGL
jgi:putative DNA primase/helicase